MQLKSLSHFMLVFLETNTFFYPILWSNEQQIIPANSLNEFTIEFQLETDRYTFTDLRSTRLFINGRIIKGDRRRLDNTEKTLLVKKALHSLFSNFEVYLNNEQVQSANPLYDYQAFVSAELSGKKGSKESLYQCQGHRYEIEPNVFTKERLQCPLAIFLFA